MENNNKEQQNENLLEGRNAINEALRAGVKLDRLYVAENTHFESIIAKAKAGGAVVVICDRKKLDKMSQTNAHQGIIALTVPFLYKELEDIFKNAEQAGEAPLIVVCDGIEDPHNLGAIIRSAEVFGANGVIIQKRRCAPITAVAVKSSAGAVMHIPIVRVSNISTAIEKLKQNGVWVFGTDANAKEYADKARLFEATAIVIGSEGYGMSELVAKNCDFTIKIPQVGKINSLNASNAAAVVLYEARRQRGVTNV